MQLIERISPRYKLTVNDLERKPVKLVFTLNLIH
jgi:hypothetical protein